MIKRDKLNQTVNTPGQKKEGTFDRYNDPTHPRYERYHKRFPLILNEIIGPKVLDAGCGTGLTCFLASKKKYIKEIHGVDLQKSVLKDAKKNVKSKKVTFHSGFVEEMAFENEYFNTVVLGETIEHVTSVSETLKEVHRVLKAGGKVIITCPYKGDTSKLHIRSITRKFLKERVNKYFSIKKFELIKYPGPGPVGIFCVGVKNE